MIEWGNGGKALDRKSMNLLDLTRGRLFVPRLRAADKRGAIEELIDFMFESAAISPEVRPAVRKAVFGREEFMSTGMEHGIALPHGVTDAVDEEMAAVGISREGIPFDSFDGEPAHIIILLITPTLKAITRVRTLAEIARVVNSAAVRMELDSADTVAESIRILRAACKAA